MLYYLQLNKSIKLKYKFFNLFFYRLVWTIRKNQIIYHLKIK